MAAFGAGEAGQSEPQNVESRVWRPSIDWRIPPAEAGADRRPGPRMLRGFLYAEGFETGRRHVVTLMKRMAIEAIYRKPNTSKPTPGHKIYPYLLRKLQIDRPNQV